MKNNVHIVPSESLETSVPYHDLESLWMIWKQLNS
jgi:hypothetical protein